MVPRLWLTGTLSKRGHFRKSWKARFFDVRDGELCYYTARNGKLKGKVRSLCAWLGAFPCASRVATICWE